MQPLGKYILGAFYMPGTVLTKRSSQDLIHLLGGEVMKAGRGHRGGISTDTCQLPKPGSESLRNTGTQARICLLRSPRSFHFIVILPSG